MVMFFKGILSIKKQVHQTFWKIVHAESQVVIRRTYPGAITGGVRAGQGLNMKVIICIGADTCSSGLAII